MSLANHPLRDHPKIRELAELANADAALLPFFGPVERAVIEMCKELCKDHDEER